LAIGFALADQETSEAKLVEAGLGLTASVALTALIVTPAGLTVGTSLLAGVTIGAVVNAYFDSPFGQPTVELALDLLDAGNDFLGDVYSDLRDTIKGFVDGTLQAIEQAKQALENGIQSLPEIRSDLQGALESLTDAALESLTNLASGAYDSLFGPAAWDDLMDSFGGPLPEGDYPDLTDPLYTGLFSDLAGFMDNLSAAFDAAKHMISPLVLDLDGDGVELTALEGSAAFFDLDGDGFAEQTGWVGLERYLKGLRAAGLPA
jgi:hypothetical protein